MARKAMENGKADSTPNLASAELVMRGRASNRNTAEARLNTAHYLFNLFQAIRPVEGLRHFFMSDTFRGLGLGFETLTAFRRWLSEELEVSKDDLKQDTEIASRIFGSCDGDIVRLAFTLEYVIETTKLNAWLFTWSKELVRWAKKDIALAMQGYAEISEESRKIDYKEIESEYRAVLFPKTKAEEPDDTPRVDNVTPSDTIAKMVKGGITFSEGDALQVIGTLSDDDRKRLFKRVATLAVESGDAVWIEKEIGEYADSLAEISATE